MLYDPERHWIKDAGCRGQPEKMFFGDSPAYYSKKPSEAHLASWEDAKEFCQKCPVLNQCRRDTLGEEFGVWGGYDQFQRHLIRRAIWKRAHRWPERRRQAWAAVIWGLRHRGRNWGDIQRETGIIQVLAVQLYEEHQARLTAEREAEEARQAAVIDLPLPELEKVPFPAEPSPQDMWVRHDRTVASAFYKGETADGAWVLAQVAIKGRSTHSQKWVRAAEIRFDREVPRLIREYAGRRDAERSAA